MRKMRIVVSYESGELVSYASFPLPILASAYRPRRDRQWRQAPLARSPGSLSLNQRLVCEPFASHAIYEAIEPRQGVVLDVALIQPERKFVNVAVKMFRAGVMIDADQARASRLRTRFRCRSWSRPRARTRPRRG